MAYQHDWFIGSIPSCNTSIDFIGITQELSIVLMIWFKKIFFFKDSENQQPQWFH